MGRKPRELRQLEIVGADGTVITATSVIVRNVKLELARMMKDDKYSPRYRIVRLAVEMERNGISMENMRRMYFDHYPQDMWVKFKRCMFAIQVTSSEDVGHELLLQRDMAIDRIRAEIEKMKELQKSRPMLFHKEIIDSEKKIAELHSDTAKRLVDIGAVGKKKSSGSVINIYNYIPRPSRPTSNQKVLHAQVLSKISNDEEAVAEQAEVVVEEVVPSGYT